MQDSNRIQSIDIMRGLTLILLILVIDLITPVVQAYHDKWVIFFQETGLIDWVFPGFLFMFGMVIPFSIEKKIKNGINNYAISRQIVIKTISLLIIGILMLNISRIEPVLTGMSRNLWAILMYIGVFLTWNDYRENGKSFFTVTGLRLAGMALLTFLVFRFRSGEPENDGSIITSWWGFLGLIGWGYLIAAFSYLLFKDSVLKISLLLFLFLVLSMLSDSGLIDWPVFIKTIFGVIINGYVPFIILSGLIAGVIIKNSTINIYGKVVTIFAVWGIGYLVVGFLLWKYLLSNGFIDTTGKALITCGIILLVFSVICLFADLKKFTGWAGIIRPAGENSITTFLVPQILYHLAWISGIPLLLYKQSDNIVIMISGAIVWTLLVIQVPVWISKINIRLKI